MRRILLCAWLTIVALAAAIPMQAIKVYYNNPKNWTDVHVYVYKGVNKVEAWPGTKISKSATADNLYEYEIPDEYADGGMVIFNNGKGDQYPTEDGKLLSGKSMMLLQNKDNDSETSWVACNDAPATVYFNNKTTGWATPHYYYFGNAEIDGSWPGAAMTKVGGTQNIWEATIPAASNVIFTDGASDGTKQTDDLLPVNNHVYTLAGDQGTYEGEDVADQPFYIYFDNTVARWATPTIHYWGGTTESTWPGFAMTKEATGNIWKYQVAAGTNGILFNAGDGDASKTGNFVAVKNHVYTQAGDSGKTHDEYTGGSTPSVEAPAALRIIGTLKGKNWLTTEAGTIAMTKSDNKFTATNVEIVASQAGATTGFFSLITLAGADWNAVNGGDRYGAMTDDAKIIFNEGQNTASADFAKYATGVNASSAKSWEVKAGKYDIEVDFANMTITLTDKTVAIETGVATLSIPDTPIHQASQGQLAVRFTMNKPVIGVQFDIALPEGITAVGQPDLSDVMEGHQIYSGTVNGKTRVVIYSQKNAQFSRNNGNLIYLTVEASNELAVGSEHTVTISNIIFSDVDRKPVSVENVTGKIIIEAADTQIALDETNIVLAIGETKQLNATLTPTSTKTITWSSSNEAVATVNQEGLVTGKAKGTALITATCDGVSASATVSVGKQTQTITWDQDLSDNIGIGEDKKVGLTATTNAEGLTVEYSIISGSTYAELQTVNGTTYIVGKKVGQVVIQANQRGNDSYAPANSVEKTVNIWKGYIEGDANGDKDITLTDVTMTLGYICGENPTGFNAAAVDLNADGTVDIADVTLLIDLLLDKPATQTGSGVHAVAASSMERFAINAADAYELNINITNMSNYIATMFEMTLPEGAVVSQAYVKGSNHGVAFRKLDDTTTRFIVTSLDNSTFNAAGTINIIFDNAIAGDVAVKAPVLNDATYTDIRALGAATTVGASAINSIEADAASDAVFYNLQGARVANPQGVYIKVQDGKAAKYIK